MAVTVADRLASIATQLAGLHPSDTDTMTAIECELRLLGKLLRGNGPKIPSEPPPRDAWPANVIAVDFKTKQRI